MKRIYKLFVLVALFSFSQQANAQNFSVDNKCAVDKEVGEGVFLGVQIRSYANKKGTTVVSVVEDTEAAAMGIQKKDVITSINKVAMDDQKFMVDWVGAQYAGMPVTIELLRDGKKMKFKGKLRHKSVETLQENIDCNLLSGKLAIENVSTYPNPSRGDFTLSFDSKTDAPYSVRLVDMSGNVAFENTIQPNGKTIQEQISVNHKVSGDYIVIIEQDGRTFQKKMVFMK